MHSVGDLSTVVRLLPEKPYFHAALEGAVWGWEWESRSPSNNSPFGLQVCCSHLQCGNQALEHVGVEEIKERVSLREQRSLDNKKLFSFPFLALRQE